MYFQHSGEIWRVFPALVPGVLYVDGITSQAEVGARVDRFAAVAKARLADGPEGELPEIQAWRRAFAQLGLKPTQYRCASESLLRRFTEHPAPGEVIFADQTGLAHARAGRTGRAACPPSGTPPPPC